MKWNIIKERCIHQIENYISYLRETRDSKSQKGFQEYRCLNITLKSPSVPPKRKWWNPFSCQGKSSDLIYILEFAKQERLPSDVPEIWFDRRKVDHGIDIIDIDNNSKNVRVAIAVKQSDCVESIKHILHNKEIGRVCLVEDMIWLTQALLKFYQNLECELQLPQQQHADPRPPIYIKGSTTQQQSGVDGAISNSMFYVCGAPGTGKTAFVIAGCILSFINLPESERMNKTIMVVAPTNLSLDQVLRGILEKIPDLTNGRLMRYGTPSSKFKKDFPNNTQSDKDENAQTVLVRAATLDYFVLNSDRFTDVKQVLVDEAGYCSLIKTIPLLYLQCPISFFGDHKQLPPIVEHSESGSQGADFSAHPFSYFKASALMMKSVFESPQEPLSFDDFGTLSRVNLDTSYRYGPELAELLKRFFYEDFSEFTGKGKTELYYCLTDGGMMEGEKRVSREDINKSIQIAKELRGRGEFPCILFFYKNPVNEAKRYLVGFSGIETINVHRAQGREFDTVILCVCDTPQNAFFTSTSRQQRHNAATIINTAVSRVRKKLIVVCNRMWKNERKEFISQLIKISNEYKTK